MREIEVKAKLINPDQAIEKLKLAGCELSEPKIQEDVVYTKIPASNVETYLTNDAFLRIRVQSNGEILFTVKKDLGNLVKIEHETIVGDAKEMEEILTMLGYQKAVRVRKSRRKAEYNGDEICIDEVDDLGAFIEVERLDNTDMDAARIQETLLVFLQTLGVQPEDRVNKGYDILMLEKNQK